METKNIPRSNKAYLDLVANLVDWLSLAFYSWPITTRVDILCVRGRKWGCCVVA